MSGWGSDRKGIGRAALVAVMSLGLSACDLGEASTASRGDHQSPTGPSRAGAAPNAAVDGGSSGDTAPTDPLEDCIEPACLNVPLPPSPHAVRLTHKQWESTTRDLLRMPAAPGLSTSFPADPVPPPDQFGSASGSLVVSSALWYEYQRAAETLAKLIVTDATALDRLLPVGAKTGDTNARIEAFVTDFLPRAYRRPVTPGEIARLVSLGESVVASDTTSDPFLLRLQWILASVLQSPFYVYRVEGGDGPVTDGRVRLGPYELASKLSYALWGTMPNAELTAHAAAGDLDTDAGIHAVVSVMLEDPKFDDVLVDFHDELFAIDAFASVTRTTSLYPKFYEAFGRDAQEDVRRTIRDAVITGNGGVAALYGGDAAFVNASLAGIYGIDPSSVPVLVQSPTTFTKVTMPSPRKGLLSHVGWLAMEGKSKDPATIQRGVYMARHVLCISLGSPPPAAAGKDPSQIDAPTNRQRVAGITAGCGDGCHGGQGGVINPLGFAFEEFDSLGVFRLKDNDVAVDSTGTIDQLGAFADAGDLMSQASTNPRTHACYAAHWSAWLNGLTEVKVTPKWLSPIIDKSMKGASIRQLVAELVQQDAFLTVSR